MDAPRKAHEAALAARNNELAGIDRTVSVFATARLVVFFLAVALIFGIAWAHLPSPVWFGVVTLVVVFVGLIVVHARVHRRRDHKLAAVRFHERALARMSGDWKGVGLGSERWAVATHPYSGDLDVFGRASLFQLIDQTSTRFGEEVLARWLSGDTKEASDASAGDVSVSDDAIDFADRIRERQAAVRDLAARLTVREELAVLGSLLDDEAKKQDPRPFVMWAGQSTRLPGIWQTIAIVMPILSIGVAVASSVGLVPRVAFLVPFVASLALLNSMSAKLMPVLNAASSKEGALARYSGMLAVLESEPFEAKELVAQQARLRGGGSSATREMASLARIVGFLDARENAVFRLFIGPILMWDLWCALALDRWRARAGRAAFGWFRALAELEALSSLAGFAFERPDHVFPEIVREPVLTAKSLGHPLIDGGKRVSNDVALEGPGHALVVTGSNMSGKSTLLRALGINVVLANAGAPVCATAMSLGRLRVATSMRVSDSLEEGTSRFYAELKKLKLVLELARASAGKKNETVLFLLDEILHGTNTRERLIGARAILRELLSQGAMGAVSTHDLALGDLEAELPDRVKNVHFEEQVADDVMTFDYKLRTGIVQSSNALRLMKIVGLDIVEPAR